MVLCIAKPVSLKNGSRHERARSVTVAPPAQMPARDATVASPAAALGSAGWQVMGPGYT